MMDNLKKEIRKRCINNRNNLSLEEIYEKSRIIALEIGKTPEFKKATRVMIYKGIKGEVRLEKLTRIDPSKEYFYPLCIENRGMKALRPLDDNGWKAGAFGILEPVPELSREAKVEELDLIICPCTSFDTKRNRMGMGGGYYDRFLPKCTKASIFCVAFQCQKSDNVPVETYDFPMDKIFTEENVY